MDGEESSEAADDEVGQSAGVPDDEPAGSRTPDEPADGDSDDPADERLGTGESDGSSDPDDAETVTEGSGDTDHDPGSEADEDVDDVGTEVTEADDGSEPVDDAGAAEATDRGKDEGDVGVGDDADDGDGNEVDEDDEAGEDDREPDEPRTDAEDDEASNGDESGEAEAEEAVEDGFLGGMTGPEGDREMPLTEHIEEMVKRLAAVIAVAGLVSLVVFPVADQIVTFLWFSIMPGVPSEIARPRLYGVLEKLFTEIKVASLAGLIVALPVIVYETYAFMRPGLYPHERRYYLAAVPTSLVLAIVGVAFAYFVVLPVIFVYFLYYSQDVATIGFALGRTFDLVLLMMGYLAVVFQIPLFIMLAMMMGLVTRRWLAERRLLFWGAFLGISFLFGFDPTGMAPIIVAATMIALFEGTLLLTKWTGKE